MRFTIVRHGETLANQQMLLSGSHDTPLSTKGKEQAKLVGTRLAGEQFTKAFSSDLSRAVDTAQAILSHHPTTTLKPHPLIRERSFGELEGQPVAYFFELLKKTGKSRFEFEPPRGETVDQVATRVQRFFAEHPFNDDDHILIVGHFSLNKALIFQLLGWPLNRWEEVSQDNTCVNSIEKNGEQLVHYSLNCTRHLTT